MSRYVRLYSNVYGEKGVEYQFTDGDFEYTGTLQGREKDEILFRDAVRHHREVGVSGWSLESELIPEQKFDELRVPAKSLTLTEIVGV